MKRLLLATAACAMVIGLAGNAKAQTTTATGTGTANSSSNSGAVAISGGGTGTGTATSNATGGKGGKGGQGGSATGGNAAIIFNTPGSTTSNTTSRIRQSGSLKTTANAIAPGLGSAAVETCYGPGVSAGVGFTGGAVSFGMGQYDEECNLRLWARTAYAFGQKDLAGALMAQSPAIMRAMRVLDEQRGANGQVVYGQPVYSGGVRAVSNDNGGGCKKWAGGNVGGQCLYY